MSSSNPSETDPPKGLWLVYFPRAAHHLFMRMFSEQSNLSMIETVAHLDSSIGPTIQLSARTSLEDVREECEALRDLMQDGLARWMRNIDELDAAGKRVLNSSSVAFQVSPAVHNAWLHRSKESNRTALDGVEECTDGYDHLQNMDSASSPSSLAFWQLPSLHDTEGQSMPNPTPFPESFLRSHLPIFLIRHPVLAFPSTLRVASEYFEFAVGDVFMNIILRYRWHRILYDWYAADTQHTKKDAPIILDADDLMYNPPAIAELCHRIGLDASKVKYEWQKESKADMRTTYQNEGIFLNTLAESTGVVKGKGSHGVDVEMEMEKWKADFGEDRAKLLRLKVEEAMEDYLYLRERSLGRLSK